MTRFRMLAMVLALSCAPLAAAQTVAPPADAGALALVEKDCSGCHAIGQVTSAHKSRDAWGATVDKMIGYGAQIPDKEVDAIVEYLAAHQGVANK